MKPIEGWKEAPAYTGEFEVLPAGKYVCQIVQVNVAQDQKGREQMILLFDIIEGEQKGYYDRMFQAAKKNNASQAKWKGVFRQFTQGNSLPFFKGIITSIEKSNPGYQWNWDEKSLVKKKFGGIFGREEFLTNDGKKKMATKCVQIRSLDGLKDAEVPEDKHLPENVAPQQAQGYPYINNGIGDGFMNIPDGVEDEGLPFN